MRHRVYSFIPLAKLFTLSYLFEAIHTFFNMDAPKACGPPPNPCTCTIQQSLGLPCYHTIWERKSNGGAILLDDLHYYWYYYRPIGDITEQAEVSTLILNPVVVKGKGRPRGALGGISRIASSSTKRYPSAFELPSSSAPPVLQYPKSPPEQLYIVNSGIKPPSSTSIAMARLQAGHIDEYKPGTRCERGYMYGIASIYKDDCIEDASSMAVRALQNEVIGGIEVHTQDAEFEWDDDVL
jgi:hypothetical protein